MEHEALAFHAADTDYGALAVGHLAGIVLVVKLGEVERRVLAADVVVGAVDAALGVPEEAFGGVGGDLLAVIGGASVLFHAVVHGFVRGELFANLRVDTGLVRVQVGFCADVFLQELRDRLAGNQVNHARPHAASAFDE